jgi:hypothetical protein
MQNLNIILVHGTFRGDTPARQPDDPSAWLEEDLQPVTATTPRWWQPHSKFCQHLRTHLANEFQLTITPFEWSGDNSDTARRAAGSRLLAHVRRNHEATKQAYYIIAHSHGGMVAWHALMASVPFKRLRYLRGLTTVGTPFLRNRITLTPLLYTILLSSFVLAIVLHGTTRAMVLQMSANSWRLTLDAWTNLTEHRQWEAAIPCAVAAVLTITLLVFTCRLVTLSLTPLWVWPIDALEKIKSWRVARIYGKRTQSIYSTLDEAIQGLRCIIDPPAQALFRITIADRTPFARFVSVLTWPARVLHNSTLAPILDYVVSRRVLDRLHGTDRGGRRMVNVEYARLGSAQPLGNRVTADLDRGGHCMSLPSSTAQHSTWFSTTMRRRRPRVEEHAAAGLSLWCGVGTSMLL